MQTLYSMTLRTVTLLDARPRRLDERQPALILRLNESCEFFGAALNDRRPGAHESFAYIRPGQHFLQFARKPRDHFPWHSGRSDETLPTCGFEIGVALLARGRDARQLGVARRARNRDRLELARLYLRRQHGAHVDQNVRLSRN